MKICLIKELINNFSEENIMEYINVLPHVKNMFDSSYELKFIISNFKEYINLLPCNILIFIVKKENKVIGSATLNIENVINTKSNLKIGHIEDIFFKDFESDYKNLLINFLIKKSKFLNCYKIVIH